MLGKIYSIIIAISVFFAICNGNVGALGEACIGGAISAVKFMLELGALMSFWCGIMAVFERFGVLKIFARLIRPLLAMIFPDAAKRGTALEEISMNVGANFLGLGNAATPMGLRAMEKMKQSLTSTDDMIMLTVLNTASIQLIPTTLLSLRIIAGAQRPYEIVVPIWLCSALTMLFAVMVTKAMSLLYGKKTNGKNK